ncbi:MFS transporter [Tenuibacillus multivorans]|nr:MFS transporter [Tenuibacillus multivorans]
MSAAGVNSSFDHRDPRFWRLSIGLMLASVFVFSNLYIVQPMLPILVNEFNVSPTESSLVFSVTTFSLLFSLLWFGFLSDRIGRLGILNWSMALSVVPLFIIPNVESFYLLVFLRFLTGISIAGLPAVAVAYITEEVSPRSRGLAVTLYISSNGLGAMAGRIFGGYWSENFTWHSSFYLLGTLGIIIALLCVFLLPRSKNFVASDQSFKHDLKGMFVHLKNVKLIYAFIFGMMLQIGFSGIWVYTPFYLEGPPFYLSIQIISLFYLAYMMGIIGSPIAGKLADHFGYVRVMFSGLAIMLLGAMMTAISSVVAIGIGLSVLCLGFFMAHSLTSSWVGMTAKHHKSGASSIYLFSYYIGSTIGGTGIGLIWTGIGWTGVVMVCVCLPLISGVLFYKAVH